MEDVLKRLGAVESTVSDIKAQVSGLVAVMPHLATKADLASLRTALTGDTASLRTDLTSDIASVRTELKTDIASLRTELKTDIASVRTEVAQVESSLIKWIVGTSLAAVSMAFVIARYVTP